MIKILKLKLLIHPKLLADDWKFGKSSCKQKLTSFGVFHALSLDFLALDILNTVFAVFFLIKSMIYHDQSFLLISHGF